MVGLILLIAAFICAVLAALNVPSAPPNWPFSFNLGWLALALYLLSLVIGTAVH
jgi:hypothetical protein